MRKVIKFCSGVLGIVALTLLSGALYLQATLPSYYNIEQGESLSLGKYSKYLSCELATDEFPIGVYRAAGNSYKMDVKLLGLIDVKTVNVQVVNRRCVVPCGTPFGIKMFTDGVMVVGTGDVEVDGVMCNPAKEAGIEVGDVIVSMAGEQTLTKKDVGRIIAKSEGETVSVMVKRGEYMHNLLLKPIKASSDENYRIGLWVRDSSAGIGTMTFYDPGSGVFAGLGHAITDVDTQDIMPLYQGEIVEATITGVKRGVSGIPGELKGMFSADAAALGDLKANNQTGVYGVLNRLPVDAAAIPMAFPQEVKTGSATILATLSGGKPKEYDIIIEKINYSDAEPTKNMIIRIVDPELLEKAGGIVQGMSGSPILQNGFLVGAVTHVFVNEPTKGFGIFAENMDQTLQGVALSAPKAA